MRLEKSVYEKILKDVPINPPEMGGILGGNRKIVLYTEYDLGITNGKCKKCSYVPNVSYLNHLIGEWSQNKIEFYGIFHTHYGGVASLSKGDKMYINKIMRAMPTEITELYFPIVILPERSMVSYICKKVDGKISIIEDKIEIIEHCE